MPEISPFRIYAHAICFQSSDILRLALMLPTENWNELFEQPNILENRYSVAGMCFSLYNDTIMEIIQVIKRHYIMK